MRVIALPQIDFRVLSLQLQGFQPGYTVEQIRHLDKVVSCLELSIKDFNKKIVEFKETKVEEKDFEAHDKKFKEYIEVEGQKTVNCSIEDADFEFLKGIWSKMSGFRGDNQARKSVITIDDAINSAKAPVFN